MATGWQDSGTKVIRPYREQDLAAVYAICVQTADAGGDARSQYRSDDLMPDLFAGPYVFLEPSLAFVLDADPGPGVGQDHGAERTHDDDRDHGNGRTHGDSHTRGPAVGYVVGTADTAAFARAYRDRWIPRLADRYPVPPDPPVTPDDQMLALHYRPERLLWPGLDEYPAHLHIDLLPSFQGAGHGRRLLETFCAAAARAGAPGVHVCVATANVRALGFYRRLGFGALMTDEPGGVVYLGREL